MTSNKYPISSYVERLHVYWYTFCSYLKVLTIMHFCVFCSVPAFGLDVSAQFDVHMQPAPTVVLKCVQAVESRGRYSVHVYSGTPL